MRKLQNTLYITTQGSYLHKERETLVVEQERKKVCLLYTSWLGCPHYLNLLRILFVQHGEIKISQTNQLVRKII